MAQKVKKLIKKTVLGKKRSFFNSIKEEKIKAKRVSEKLAYYKKVIADSNDAIIIQDFNGVIKSWNKGAERIYGFKEREMLGKNILKIIDKNYRAAARKNIRAIKGGKPTFRINQIRNTKDKKEVSVWITYSPIYEDEEIIEIATTEQDITRSLKSVADLVESEHQLRVISDAITNGMDIVDEKCNIIWMNNIFLKIFGKKSIGKKCYSLYKKDKKQCINCPLKKQLRLESQNR
jgi:two-component system sensor histidine kinase/response regulator